MTWRDLLYWVSITLAAVGAFLAIIAFAALRPAEKTLSNEDVNAESGVATTNLQDAAANPRFVYVDVDVDVDERTPADLLLSSAGGLQTAGVRTFTFETSNSAEYWRVTERSLGDIWTWEIELDNPSCFFGPTRARSLTVVCVAGPVRRVP